LFNILSCTLTYSVVLPDILLSICLRNIFIFFTQTRTQISRTNLKVSVLYASNWLPVVTSIYLEGSQVITDFELNKLFPEVTLLLINDKHYLYVHFKYIF
jgi:hypothetical protein